MPCTCGKKVERLEAHKIQCVICKQFVHGNCYNINFDEINFLKNFKCNECLNLRRRSLSSSSFFVDVETAAELVGESEKPIANDKTMPILAVSSISVGDVYNELIALKNNNVNLMHLVTSLCNDNVKLLRKVDDLEFIVRNLQSSMPNENSIVAAINANIHKNSALKWSDVVAADAESNKNNNIVADDVVVVKSANNNNNKLINASSSNKAQSTLSVVNNMTPKTKSSMNATVDVANNSNANVIDANAASHVNNNNNNDTVGSFVINNNKPSSSSSSGMLVDLTADDNNKVASSSPKRHNKNNNKKNVIYGSNLNTELSVFARRKWLHISSFKNTVQESDIISYLSKMTKISAEHFSCFKLIKKDANINAMKYINFKLGVTAGFYDTVLNANIWPANIKIRSFAFLEKVNTESAQVMVIPG